MRLSNVKLFAVRPTSSALKFDDTRQNPLDAGRALGVESVIEGRIEDAGDHLRVSAKLWRVADGALLWSDSFDAQLENFSADAFTTVSQGIALEIQSIVRNNKEDNKTIYFSY